MQGRRGSQGDRGGRDDGLFVDVLVVLMALMLMWEMPLPWVERDGHCRIRFERTTLSCRRLPLSHFHCLCLLYYCRSSF